MLGSERTVDVVGDEHAEDLAVALEEEVLGGGHPSAWRRISGSPDEVGGERQTGLERAGDRADRQPGAAVLRRRLDGRFVDDALRAAGRVEHDDAAGLLLLRPPDRLGEGHVVA